jgi:hypothetical protein
MRTRRQIILIAMSMILFSSPGCKNSFAQEKFSDEKIKEMIKNFYTSYITINSFGVDDRKKSDSVQRLYCTPKLYNFLRKQYMGPPGKIDYDVFLKSQMFDIRMLEKLTVRKDSMKNDVYYVVYTYGKEQTTIELRVVKEKEDYKIDHVFIKGIDE